MHTRTHTHTAPLRFNRMEVTEKFCRSKSHEVCNCNYFRIFLDKNKGLEASHSRIPYPHHQQSGVLLVVSSISSKIHHFLLNSWSIATQTQQHIFARDHWNNDEFESSAKSIVLKYCIYVSLNHCLALIYLIPCSSAEQGTFL